LEYSCHVGIKEDLVVEFDEEKFPKTTKRVGGTFFLFLDNINDLPVFMNLM